MSAQQVTPEPGSRLAELIAVYNHVKATADAAAERLRVVTEAIKAEAIPQAPTATSIELTGAVPLRLVSREQWRIDTKRLKAEDPLTYVRYAKKSVTWSLSRGGLR